MPQCARCLHLLLTWETAKFESNKTPILRMLNIVLLWCVRHLECGLGWFPQ